MRSAPRRSIGSSAPSRRCATRIRRRCQNHSHEREPGEERRVTCVPQIELPFPNDEEHNAGDDGDPWTSAQFRNSADASICVNDRTKARATAIVINASSRCGRSPLKTSRRLAPSSGPKLRRSCRQNGTVRQAAVAHVSDIARSACASRRVDAGSQMPAARARESSPATPARPPGDRRHIPVLRSDEPPQAEQDVDRVGHIPRAGDDFVQHPGLSPRTSHANCSAVRPSRSSLTARKNSGSQNRFCSALVPRSTNGAASTNAPGK